MVREFVLHTKAYGLSGNESWSPLLSEGMMEMQQAVMPPSLESQYVSVVLVVEPSQLVLKLWASRIFVDSRFV